MCARVASLVVEKFFPSASKKWALASVRIPSLSLIRRTITNGFLIEKLKDAGCEVEWGAKLTGFSEGENGVRATIEHDTGRIEEAEIEYICGCDGARSLCAKLSRSVFRAGHMSNCFMSRT